jgi:dTDP-4-amino-4,6-dideoxygalactose transaminase
MVRVPHLSLKETYLELKPELDLAYARVMESGHFILGPEVEAFEKEFAEYCGSKYCLGISNGLDALALVLKAWRIGPGDEVIVPSNTFIATWLAVSQVGAQPVPVDPVASTQNIDPEKITKAITSKTKAIIPVHLYGAPAAMDEINNIAHSRNLLVLEDAAQAQGAKFKGQRCGSLGMAAGFSFYPGKNLGAFGDGGAITTSDSDLYERLKMLRNYGSKIKYKHEEKGYNNRMDELQAAFLRVKLRALNEWNARREVIAKRYIKEFSGLPLRLPEYPVGVESSWHLFVVHTPKRDELQKFLAEKGVGTLIHYPLPPLEQNAYVELRDSYHSDFKDHTGLLSLPIGPHMSEEMVTHVCSRIKEFFS